MYDLIVIGSGGAGMIASIVAARRGKHVLLLEKLPKLGAKLKASGGGRCNLTNTLSNAEFMNDFGREGRFMMPSLEVFDHRSLISFFDEIGVQTHSPDGFRVFPKTHDSTTILSALIDEMSKLNIEIKTSTPVKEILFDTHKVTGVNTQDDTFHAHAIILATGGLGYPTLGTQGDGYTLSSTLGHSTTALFPAMIPLHTKERWVEKCRADTLPKVLMKIDLPKAKKLHATGDLIFTKKGIRGPVVLDFAREITPFLEKYGTVPLLVNLTGGMNEDAIFQHIKKHSHESILTCVSSVLPQSLVQALCEELHIDANLRFKELEGKQRETLIKYLAWTPLTITGHDGFDKAMVTRGGIQLKEIHPNTLESKKKGNLFFCGEVMNLDGPCGGYNLQWAFASGYVAGHTGEEVKAFASI